MSQRHRIQHGRIMFVTTCTVHRVPFFADPAVAREAVERLYRMQSLHPFFLYGFVIMPDHCHLLLKVEQPQTISGIIGAYKSGLTFDCAIPKMWQPRFHCRLPRNPAPALRYIHQNPVKATIVERAKDYPWSSASGRWEVEPLPMRTRRI